MKTNPVANKYPKLTPEERFRLVVAAGARGDDNERERLSASGERIVLSLPDHAPYSHAMHEVSDLTYLEILDAAAFYLETFEHAAEHWDNELDEPEDDDQEGDDDSDDDEPIPQEQSIAGIDRHDALVRAAGYLLHAKVNGWKSFCDSLTIPPFAIWQELPGFERLERTLRLAAIGAFSQTQFAEWLVHTRKPDDPPPTSPPLTAESYADGLEKLFRHRVKWWSGLSIERATCVPRTCPFVIFALLHKSGMPTGPQIRPLDWQGPSSRPMWI